MIRQMHWGKCLIVPWALLYFLCVSWGGQGSEQHDQMQLAATYGAGWQKWKLLQSCQSILEKNRINVQGMYKCRTVHVEKKSLEANKDKILGT